MGATLTRKHVGIIEGCASMRNAHFGYLCFSVLLLLLVL